MSISLVLILLLSLASPHLLLHRFRITLLSLCLKHNRHSYIFQSDFNPLSTIPRLSQACSKPDPISEPFFYLSSPTLVEQFSSTGQCWGVSKVGQWVLPLVIDIRHHFAPVNIGQYCDPLPVLFDNFKSVFCSVPWKLQHSPENLSLVYQFRPRLMTCSLADCSVTLTTDFSCL